MSNKKIKNFWKNTNKEDKLCWVVIGIIFFVFVLQALFFAFYIKENLPPDEFYHIKLSEIYSKHFGLVNNGENTYYLGEISRVPFLFHWLAGRVINIKNLIFPNLMNYIALRLFSVFISCLNVFIAFKIIRFLTKDKLVHILFLTMLTNTLMFVFMSGAVSYDPLSVLFSALIIIFTLKLFQHHNIETLALVVLFTLLGCITKVTFLPLAFISTIFLVVHEIKYIKKYQADIKEIFKIKKGKRFRFIVCTVMILFFLGLTVNLYGTNLIRYHSIKPSCAEVMKVEQCMKNGEFANYYELESVAPPEESLMKPFWYVPHWLYLMVDRTYGIFTHLKLSLTYEWFLVYFLILVFGIIKFIRDYDKKRVEQPYFLLLIIFYTIVLMMFTNYLAYKTHGIIHAGVQGRYMFPVLIPLYALLSSSILSFKNKYIKWVLFISVMVVFLYGNLPFFVRNVTDEWFTTGSNGLVIIEFIKRCFYFFFDKIKNLL